MCVCPEIHNPLKSSGGAEMWMKSLQEQHKPVAIEHLFPYKYCGNLASQVCCWERAEDCRVCLIMLQTCLLNHFRLSTPHFVLKHITTMPCDAIIWSILKKNHSVIWGDLLWHWTRYLKMWNHNQKGCIRAGKLAPVYIFPVYFPVVCHKGSSCYSSLKKKEWGLEF